MSKITEKLNTDRILSVCAILIGVMTLIVYFVQTRLLMEQQHAGVWPCIQISGTNDYQGTKDKEYFTVNIDNKGIGPALIKKVEIKFQGKTYNNFSEVFEIYTKSSNYVNSSLEGRTISSEEIVNPIKIPLSVEGHKFAQLFYHSDSLGLQVKIYYKSVYGKCFVSSGFDAKELPDCSVLEEKK
jgi:hypothetical protein